MNEQNYASFEASKKLFEAGIILETEFYWVEREDWSHLNLDGSSKDIITIDEKDDCDEFAIPAISFEDAWRELPESYDGICKLQLRKYKDFSDYTTGPIVKNTVGYANLGGYGREHWEKDNNNNLTDTLISLLIWVQEYIAKEEKKRLEKRND